MNVSKAVFNWSGGKDSALALYEVLQNPKFQVQKLLTNVTSELNRVSAHGVRTELMWQQAAHIGIPLSFLELPEHSSIDEYNSITEKTFTAFKDEGISDTIFGDILLEDLRAYREGQLQPLGFNIHFPLWKRDTKELLLEFIELGFKAIVVCVKSEVLDKSFAGRILDKEFLSDLPANVDPCGENGEYHTFVYDGPIFEKPVLFTEGDLVFREYEAPKKDESKCPLSSETDPKKMGFWFLDLLPV